MAFPGLGAVTRCRAEAQEVFEPIANRCVPYREIAARELKAAIAGRGGCRVVGFGITQCFEPARPGAPPPGAPSGGPCQEISRLRLRGDRVPDYLKRACYGEPRPVPPGPPPSPLGTKPIPPQPPVPSTGAGGPTIPARIPTATSTDPSYIQPTGTSGAGGGGGKIGDNPIYRRRRRRRAADEGEADCGCLPLWAVALLMGYAVAVRRSAKRGR